jgi:hypothetical protein
VTGNGKIDSYPPGEDLKIKKILIIETRAMSRLQT